MGCGQVGVFPEAAHLAPVLFFLLSLLASLELLLASFCGFFLGGGWFRWFFNAIQDKFPRVIVDAKAKQITF